MTNTVGNVVAGRPKTAGGVYRAPLGSTLPTDSTTALDAAFVALGYAGDAGVTETNGRTTNTIQAWGTDIVKVVQTEFSVTYQVTLIESLGANANKAAYGDSAVSSTAASSAHGNRLAVSVKAAPLDHNCWAFDMKDGDASYRIVVPDGQMIAVGDITYSDGGVVAYPITIQAFPDSSGNNAYKYSDDGQTT